jgi:hypothetical protein
MAETLGSLCDKLTIVRLKQWHSKSSERLKSLARQMNDLQGEIDAFVSGAITQTIPVTRLKFAANKVYREESHVLGEIAGGFGSMISKLAEVNCALWHQQEKIYDFEKVPPAEKNTTIKRLAVLNLERNRCIERIDDLFREQIVAAQTKTVRSSADRRAAAQRKRSA